MAQDHAAEPAKRVRGANDPPPGWTQKGIGRVAIGFVTFGIRLIMLVPILATQAAALVLMAFGAVQTWHFAAGLIADGLMAAHDVVLYQVIEIIDLFLVATVAEVVSLGLYQLYFHIDLELPAWLKIETLEDLKSKLVGVTITVLAVFFLGRVLLWQNDPSIAWLGGGVAVMVVALTWFLSKIDHH